MGAQNTPAPFEAGEEVVFVTGSHAGRHARVVESGPDRICLLLLDDKSILMMSTLTAVKHLATVLPGKDNPAIRGHVTDPTLYILSAPKKRAGCFCRIVGHTTLSNGARLLRVEIQGGEFHGEKRLTNLKHLSPLGQDIVISTTTKALSPGPAFTLPKPMDIFSVVQRSSAVERRRAYRRKLLGR